MRLDQDTWYTTGRHELVQVSTKRLGDIELDMVTQVGNSYPAREGNLPRGTFASGEANIANVGQVSRAILYLVMQASQYYIGMKAVKSTY